MVTITPLQTQPVIGISGSSSSSKSVLAMIAQVRAQGGIPMLLSDQIHRNASDDLKKIDALMVMGNDGDIDPSLYVDKYAANDPRHAVHKATHSESLDAKGAARAVYESQLLLGAMQNEIPTLTVCGGMHRLNVLTGGELLQCVPDLVGNNNHEQRDSDIPPYTPVMPVDIVKDSKLGSVAENISTIYRPSAPRAEDTMAQISENSMHHQSIDGELLNKNFRAVAYSDHFKDANGKDARLVEAFEPAADGKLADWKMLSVQWHPEFGASPLAPKLIENLVENGREAAAGKNRDTTHDNAVAAVESLRSHGHPSFVENEMARRNAQLILAR